MGTSLESVNALKSRALEVALSTQKANALTRNGVTSLARLAFAACPGQTPTEAQLQPLLQPIELNPGNAASLKRLIFEAQTLVCNEVKIKANKKEDSPTNFAPSEREARIQQQKDRLSGLRFRGEEECAHCSYDIALTMLERDTLVYLGPEKFPTRRNELQLKKPGKEITIDQSQLIVKEKPADFTCSTNTELEVANAFRRRALAFDLVGICSYNIMTSYHADLLDHIHTPPPPGYSPISIQQILRTDRATFIFLAERMTSLKRDATNRIPINLALPNVLGQPTVAFHLLPLAGAAAKAAPTKEKPSGAKKRSRSPARQAKAEPKERKESNEDQTSQQDCSTKPWKRLRNRGFAGDSTSPTVVRQPSLRKVVPKTSRFVPNRGALNPHSLQEHR